jgi:hypothetical protein
MIREHTRGKGRRKSTRRQLGRDFRLWLPFLGFLTCYSLSATAIVVSERTTIASSAGASDHFTISSSSTSNASAAPGRMRGGAPRLP